MSKNLHLTINTHPKTSVTQSWWTLWGEREPDRVAIKYNNKEYVMVLDEKQPFFEIWNLDEQGELSEIEQTINPHELKESATLKELMVRE